MRKALKQILALAILQSLIGSKAARIGTHTSAAERICLYLDATASLKTGRFLEIGSYLGASAAVLGQVVRRSRIPGSMVYCVDTWKNDAMTEGPRSTKIL